MSERNGSLSPDQLRAVGVLAGADPADVEGCDPAAVAGWLDREPEFIAGLNRAKSYRRERLRAEIRSLTSEAVKTLRKLVRGADVPRPFDSGHAWRSWKRPTRWNRRRSAPLGSAGSRRHGVTGS